MDKGTAGATLLASFAQAFGIVGDDATSEQLIRVSTNPLLLAALWRGSIYVGCSAARPHAVMPSLTMWSWATTCPLRARGWSTNLPTTRGLKKLLHK